MGQKGNDREELASLINGPMVSEDSRIVECVVSCVTFASDSMFRDICVVLTELISGEKLFTFS
jgi:hypothetical protein